MNNSTLVQRLIQRNKDALQNAKYPGQERYPRVELDLYRNAGMIGEFHLLTNMDQLRQVKERVNEWLDAHPESDGLNQCIKDRFISLSYSLSWWLNRGATFDEFIENHTDFECVVFGAECYANMFLYDRDYRGLLCA